MKTKIGLTAVAISTATFALSPLAAHATSSTRTLTNGCRIYGNNLNYGGSAFAGVTPQSNCLQVQVKLWATSGFSSAGYTPVPNGTALSVSVPSGNVSYSDHNGTGDNNPAAYGFRLYP